MNKFRFALTSALVLLGFGLIGAPNCDCDKDGARSGVVAPAPGSGAASPIR